MKKFISILIIMTAVLAGVSALDIVVPRTYETDGFRLMKEGRPEFTVDETIWKANALGCKISSVTKHCWEIMDGEDRIIVALAADENDIRSLSKYLDRNGEGLTLFVGAGNEISGEFFAAHRFGTVAMQSYTPDVMRALRANKSVYYPFKSTDTIRVEDGKVDFLAAGSIGSETVEVKSKGQTELQPVVEETAGGKTVIVICPHCGEQITIRI